MIRPNGACTLGDSDVVQHGLFPHVPRLATRAVGGDGGTDVDDPVEFRKELSSVSASWLARRCHTFRMMITFSLFPPGTHNRKRRTRHQQEMIEDNLGNLRTQHLWISRLERCVKGASG